MYTCTICLSINHDMRLHCQNCGTVPAKYSCFGKQFTEPQCNPAVLSDAYTFREIVVARGADRIERHHITRAKLQTVTLDYYAQPSAE